MCLYCVITTNPIQLSSLSAAAIIYMRVTLVKKFIIFIDIAALEDVKEGNA